MLFDPETYLEATTTEKGSTEVLLPPERDDYTTQIEEVTARVVSTKNGDRLIFDVLHRIVSPDISDIVRRDESFVRQSIWVDLTEDGNLDMRPGANVALNRLRAAVGQNTAGKPWSPKDLIGQVVPRVRVAHRRDGDRTFADVVAVAAS